MSKECFFCSLKPEQQISESKLAFTKADDSPVTKYHSIIIPKRHFASFFDITDEELLEINNLIKLRKDEILKLDETVTGFNIGMNIGESAGQSILHVHIHLIPRRLGDLKNPKGGVRGVIPEKRCY